MKRKLCKVCNKPLSKKIYTYCKSCRQKDERNTFWKGDNVGKDALHIYLHRRIPKPKLCVKCNKRRPYDLANISGLYKRDIDDWEWLCRKCHMESDGRINNLTRGIVKNIKRNKLGRFMPIRFNGLGLMK